jgi:predicted enzyme related to lactoylglutathione lyase
MISGLHVLLYSSDPAADRAFIRDVLGWPHVEDPDSEPGWLIFKAPPTELGVHPTDGRAFAELHLMCDDIEATVTAATQAGATVGAISDRGYGLVTTMTLPSGAEIGLYQPKHPIAYAL